MILQNWQRAYVSFKHPEIEEEWRTIVEKDNIDLKEIDKFDKQTEHLNLETDFQSLEACAFKAGYEAHKTLVTYEISNLESMKE